MKQITEMHENDALYDSQPADILATYDRWREQSGKSVFADRMVWVIEFFAAALDRAGSDDPTQVALALEGMTMDGPAGPILMRAADHQIVFPMVISSMSQDVARTMLYNGDDYGVAFATDGWVPASDVEQPTTCEMKRPV